MILSELQGYKKAFQDESLEKILIKLKNSFKLANGSYAQVLIPPSKNYVYKAWISDPGYEDFLKFCKEHNFNHVIKQLSSVKTLKTQTKELADLEFRFAKNNDFLIEAVKLIDYAKSKLIRTDIGYTNVMVRGANELVITDPFMSAKSVIITDVINYRLEELR